MRSLFLRLFILLFITTLITNSVSGQNNSSNITPTIYTTPLNGTYIIGTGTADFPSLDSAIAVLSSQGVSGAVNLKVKPGIYNSQISIGAIPGINANSPLIIESLNGNANSTIIEYADQNFNNNYIFKLDYCNYIKIKNLTIRANGINNFDRAIVMNSSSNCTIEGNNIYFTNTSAVAVDSKQNNIYITSLNSNSNNIIRNNNIKNGYYGIYMIGTSSQRNLNTIIENNYFENNVNTSIYTKYSDSIKINSNIINNLETYAGGGISVIRAIGNISVSKNKISVYDKPALHLYYAVADTSYYGKIANNLIYQSNQDNETVDIDNSSYLNFYYNTVHTNGSNYSGRNININSGSNINIINNNSVNEAHGQAIYYQSSSSIENAHNNNYYSNGYNLAYWNGNSCSSILNLQNMSSKESNSVSFNTVFYSDEDLHILGPALNNLGSPINGITQDYDGDLRSTNTPDIGADEYNTYTNDAGISGFVNLKGGCPNSAHNISVEIKNYGSSNISNINIGWSINGVSQSSYSWNGNLGLLNSTIATIGNYTFLADSTYVIKTWVNTVNSANDLNAANDEITVNNFRISIPSGTYQIGSSSSADYPTIASALATLNIIGICGPITLNIESGNYEGAYNLSSPIPGSSPTNTITLQSLNGNPSTTSLFNNSNNSGSYIFNFSNSGYFKFKKLSFNTSASSWSKVFNIAENSRHITLDSCIIIGNNSSNNSDDNKLFYIHNSRQFTITNSTLNNGSEGIYIFNNNNNYSSGIIIKNNNITNFKHCGINAYYLSDTIAIQNNTIHGNNNGILTYFTTKKIKITSNDIKLTAQYYNSYDYSYGILHKWHNWTNTSSTNYSEINNNFISITPTTTFTNRIYGISIEATKYCFTYFNTVKIINSNSNISSCLYLNAASNLTFKNNILDAGNHYVMYFTNNANSFTSNYNCLYSAASSPIYYLNANKTFTYYVNAYNKDANSIWKSPAYVSINDLHIYDAVLNGAGTQINGINYDIDGDSRVMTSNPDIGADEINIFATDIQLYAINEPNNTIASGNSNIKIAIKNMGSSNITSDSLHYSIDNGPKTSIQWTGNLAPLDIDSLILIGTSNFNLGNHIIKAWSSYPNNTADQNLTNDTIAKTIITQAFPNIMISPSVIYETITNCNDSIIVPITIKNIGDAILNYNLDSNYQATGPLKVLLLTYYGSSYTNGLLQSLGYSFTNYELTPSYAYNLSILESAIIGQDVVIIPSINSNYYINVLSEFDSTLSTFVSNGGTVMYAGQPYEGIITNSGLWPNFQLTGNSHSGSVLSKTNHSITNNITSSEILYNTDYYYYFNTAPNNYTSLLNYDNTYNLAGYFPYGKGQVFYLGFTYQFPNMVLQSKLLSNSLKWIYDNRNGWRSNNSYSGSINIGDSAIVNLKLNSMGLDTGAYISSININNNSLSNPIENIPCTMIVQNQFPGGGILGNDTVVCINSPISFTATGGVNYLWSNGDTINTMTTTVSESSDYTVTITDVFCSVIDSISIIVSKPSPNIGADTTLCESLSITLDAGANNNSYIWSNGDTTQAIIIDSTGIGFGSISIDVEIADSIGCIGKDTIMISFVDCTSLNNVDAENFIMSIYPNPTKGLFTISSTETSIAKLKLEVLDLNGRIIYENQLLNTRGIISEQVDLSHKAKGIYIVRLSNGDLIKTFKVVVQ